MGEAHGGFFRDGRVGDAFVVSGVEEAGGEGLDKPLEGGEDDGVPVFDVEEPLVGGKEGRESSGAVEVALREEGGAT